MVLEKNIKAIQELYKKIQKEEEKLWRPFNTKAEKLEKIVLDRFNEVLKEIGPVRSSWCKNNLGYQEKRGATVLNSICKYYPNSNKFYIKILTIKTPYGIISETNPSGCPHVWLESITGLKHKLNPRIIAFMEEYHISNIEESPNNCDHK